MRIMVRLVRDSGYLKLASIANLKNKFESPKVSDF